MPGLILMIKAVRRCVRYFREANCTRDYGEIGVGNPHVITENPNMRHNMIPIDFEAKISSIKRGCNP
jgi:hypothetical protein